MNPIISREEQEVFGAVGALPTVSIILPFEPKMSLKSEVNYKMKVAVGKVEKELTLNYPADEALPVIEKLHRLLRNLNYNTHKKSVAIFVSPEIEKVFYLDVPVEEKIVVDEKFEIRDLVYNKKQNIQYLVMLLSAEASKTYLANCSKFQLIKTNVRGTSVHAYERDMPQKVGNFSDPAAHKEITLDNFLHHMDEGLTLLLKAYPLPVFVLGTEKVLGHFHKNSRNTKHIIRYVHGNFDDASESEIRTAMQPHIADWKKIKQQETLQKMLYAANEKRLVCGMEEVWRNVQRKNGQLLLVEKDFLFPTRPGLPGSSLIKEEPNSSRPFYIKDAVDVIIEKILETGGEVEFLDRDMLKSQGHIALIQYYSTSRENSIHFM